MYILLVVPTRIIFKHFYSTAFFIEPLILEQQNHFLQKVALLPKKQSCIKMHCFNAHRLFLIHIKLVAMSDYILLHRFVFRGLAFGAACGSWIIILIIIHKTYETRVLELSSDAVSSFIGDSPYFLNRGANDPLGPPLTLEGIRVFHYHFH